MGSNGQAVLPISAIIPTLDRPGPLNRALSSLLAQDRLPAQVIVIDASATAATREMLDSLRGRFPSSCEIVWVAAERRGAAAQRNQGCLLASQAVFWFFDDDVVFEPDCLGHLWNALESDPRLGGVNALIINQRYKPPGRVSAALYAIMNGKRENSYAGRVLGPAINVLPDDAENVPEVAPVQWLNTGCTLYRRAAMPMPPFDSVFTGYSMMEDLALSLRVGRNWKLASVRRARIFHDSQPGSYKADEEHLSWMEMVNRHYVMAGILGRRRAVDYARLFVWEVFQLAICAKNQRFRRPFWRVARGKVRATAQILAERSKLDSANHA